MKIAIIGSSISGASAALLLAGKADVTVYEKKKRKDIGKKVCANIVTASFLKQARSLGLNPKNFIISRFEKANAFSENNRISLETKEFKIDRAKLLKALIEKAEKKGARFYFRAEFLDLKKSGNKKEITLKASGKTVKIYADAVIGADGAISEVAKKSGLWENRDFFVGMQAETALRKQMERNSYGIYWHGKQNYYGYIFPSGKKAVIGIVSRPENAGKKFSSFIKTFGIKNARARAALIPKPRAIPWKDNIFLIGDAGCNIKFSGGGIVYSMKAAAAAKDAILENNYSKFKELKKGILFNRIIGRALERFDNRDFDSLIELLKKKKFSDIILKRDELEKIYLKLADFRLLKFLLKII